MYRGAICMAVAVFLGNAVSEAASKPPMAVCADLFVFLSHGNGYETMIVPPDVDGGSVDDVGITFANVFPDVFDCATLGDVVVRLTVFDAEGQHDSCETLVHVIDDVVPQARCKAIQVTLEENGQASITFQDINDHSEDNCGLVKLEVAPTGFTCDSLGDNTAVLYVEDLMGNAAACSTTVTVVDKLPPKVACRNVEAALDETGHATVDPEKVDAGTTDNCAVDRFELSKSAFACEDLGPNTVTLTAYDASGNTGTAEAIITVTDAIPPQVVCNDLVVYLGEDGVALVTPDLADGGSTDNCGIDRLELVPDTFNCDNMGANTVVLTAYDTSGNTSTCEATFTVTDDIPPNALCKSVEVFLDEDGAAYVPPDYVDAGSADNCAVDHFELSRTLFHCEDLGENPVTLTVFDASGNSATCDAVVTVTDDTKVCVVEEPGEGEGEGEGEGVGEGEGEGEGEGVGEIEQAAADEGECSDVTECADGDGACREGEYFCLAVPCPIAPGSRFEWTKDDVPIEDDPRIRGAHERVLSLRVLRLADSGAYRCTHDLGVFGPVVIQVRPKFDPSQLVGAGLLAGAFLGGLGGLVFGGVRAYRRSRRL